MIKKLHNILAEYNNTYRRSICKKPVDADCSSLTKEIEMNPKSSKFKVGDRVRMAMYKNTFSKCYTKNWSRELFVIDSVLKTNSWMHANKWTNNNRKFL